MDIIISSVLYDKFVNPLLSNESEPNDNFFTLFVVLAFTDYDMASYLIVIMTPYLGLLDYRTFGLNKVLSAYHPIIPGKGLLLLQ